MAGAVGLGGSTKLVGGAANLLGGSKIVGTVAVSGTVGSGAEFSAQAPSTYSASSVGNRSTQTETIVGVTTNYTYTYMSPMPEKT